MSLDTRKMEGAGEEGDMDVFAANGAEPVASTMLQRLRSTSNASFEDVNLDAHMEQPRTDSGPALTLDGVDPSAYDERGIETVGTQRERSLVLSPFVSPFLRRVFSHG